MRLIREVIIDEIGEFSRTYSFGAARCLGCVFTIFANPTDPFILRSITDQGRTMTHVQATPIVAFGPFYTCGGPIHGDTVNLDWQNNSNLKVARLRFYDEPIRPFGFIEIGRSSETGIAPAADSALVEYDNQSDWFNAVSLETIANQTAAVSSYLSMGIGTPAVAASFNLAANVPFHVAQDFSPFTRVGLQANNGGGANMSFHTRVLAYVR